MYTTSIFHIITVYCVYDLCIVEGNLILMLKNYSRIYGRIKKLKVLKKIFCKKNIFFLFIHKILKIKHSK